MSTRPDQYRVAGNPIAHSKSPQIHTIFAGQTGQDIEYQHMFIELGQFVSEVEQFRGEGGCGLNITLPFKTDAWAYADVRSEGAERAGAVNTLKFQGDQVYADNTDGPGLVRDLTVNHSVMIKQRRVLLLGAGGAARGTLQPLLQQQPQQLVIANRTVAKAVELAKEFDDLGAISGCGYEDLSGHDGFDLIINATAAGLTDKIPPLPDGCLQPGGCGYDMVYADKPTAFVRWAQQQGAAKALDGLGMLIEQAAESFAIWRGVRPQTAPVIASLRG